MSVVRWSIYFKMILNIFNIYLTYDKTNRNKDEKKHESDKAIGVSDVELLRISLVPLVIRLDIL